MTSLPAHAGITATRRRSGILPAILSIAVALLVGAGLGAGGAAPAHAETSPSPSPTSSGVVELAVAPLNGGVLDAQDPLTVQVALENGTASRALGGEATVMLGDAALGDRAALAAWLGGTRTPGTARVLGTTALDDAAGGQTVTAGVMVAADAEGLHDRAAGVYPLWVTLGDRSARSVVTVPGTATGTVGIVVPVTAGGLEQGLLTSTQLAEMTAPDGALTAQLDAVGGTAAILAVDPAVPAAIRVLGTAAPESARAWLARLDALPNERFALQFGDADVSAQLDAGLSAPLQPTSLVAYVDPGDAAGADGADAAAGSDLAALLAVGPDATVSATPYYWPATGTAGPGVVSALAASTPGAITLLSSTATGEGTNGQTVSAHRTVSADGSATDVLVYDGSVSAALAAAAESTDSMGRAAAVAAVSAGLSLAIVDAAGQPLLVTVDRPAGSTALGLRAAIAAVAGTRGVTIASLGALTGAEARSATVADAASDPDRVSAVGQLASGADGIARFATILEDPALLTGSERASGLQLLGNAWLDDPDAWATALADHAQATAATLSSVDILPSTSLNLLTAGTNLRFWVHNDLPYPVQVVLSAVPDDLRLDIERETAVSAGAASNTPVEVPVHARIGNGEARITLALRSPSGEQIGTTQLVDVNVRADWENIGLIALGVVVVAFVTIGIVRTVRRRRARTVAATDAAAQTDAAERTP